MYERLEVLELGALFGSIFWDLREAFRNDYLIIKLIKKKGTFRLHVNFH